MASKTTNNTDRVTIYRRNSMLGNIIKIECTKADVSVQPYAQYSEAVVVTYRAKRQRRDRRYTETYEPSTVIVRGWGHPEADSAFLPETPSQGGAVMVSRGRYSSCDPRWQRDFDAKLAAYVEATGAEIVADFRGHNPYGRNN